MSTRINQAESDSQSPPSYHYHYQDSQQNQNRYLMADMQLSYSYHQNYEDNDHEEEDCEEEDCEESNSYTVTYEHSSDLEEEESQYEEQEEEDIASNSYSNQSRRNVRPRTRQNQSSQQPEKGLSANMIVRIPTFNWSKSHEKFNKDEKCPICLSHYSLNQTVRVLNCMHRFHQHCLDSWLCQNGSCPTCRFCPQESSQE